MQFPINIELRRSRFLSFLMVLLHALAGACLWVLPWPAATTRHWLLLIIALSLWHALRPSRIVGLRLGEDGALTLLSGDGDSMFVSPQADTTVFSQLIVVRIRNDDRGRLPSLVLLPDSMPAEQFRLLRLWLRWRVRVNPGDQTAGDV
ncbi:protein YgfX [Candidatus Accumulibacter vicinus]|uniref:Toxin CptA n=1 Tax=Candidatus Accumulibacter vicinus TaxID=2954382 RepID=A0A084XVT1_9PROT|nr:protein YgfX [Candidatus Accumulibacter vicinus]KFB66575.1 MAG: hypothetical protein CAPSK01_004096 [Candidatus Accumulibacter vicinus]